jgi:hypothetical protein
LGQVGVLLLVVVSGRLLGVRERPGLGEGVGGRRLLVLVPPNGAGAEGGVEGGRAPHGSRPRTKEPPSVRDRCRIRARKRRCAVGNRGGVGVVGGGEGAEGLLGV